MIRSVVIVGLMGLAGLFGYYYFTSPATGDWKSRAQTAAARVGDKVLDESVATAVYTQLVAKYGREALRYLHVHHDSGKVLVYGLLPPNISADTLRTDAAKVPGVSSVTLIVQPRPEDVFGGAAKP